MNRYNVSGNEGYISRIVAGKFWQINSISAILTISIAQSFSYSNNFISLFSNSSFRQAPSP